MIQNHQMSGSARGAIHSRPVVPNARDVSVYSSCARHHAFHINHASMHSILRSAAGVARRSLRVGYNSSSRAQAGSLAAQQLSTADVGALINDFVWAECVCFAG